MQGSQQTGIAHVSNAEVDIDPFESAKRKVARSKDLVASATEDLHQHHRWLKDTIATEARNREKHARWLKRQQVSQQRKLKRQRLILSCKRGAWASVLVLRSISLFLSNKISSALAYLLDLLLISAAWIARRLWAGAVSLLRLMSNIVSWLWVRGNALALAFRRGTSIIASRVALKARIHALSLRKFLAISLSWTGAQTHAFARALGRVASRSASLIAVKSHNLSLSLGKLLSTGLARSRVRANAIAFASATAVSRSASWMVAESRSLSILLGKRLSIGISRGSVTAHALALASVTATFRIASWIVAKSRALSLLLGQRLSTGFSRGSVRAHAFALASVTATVSIASWIVAKSRTLSLLLGQKLSTGFSRQRVRARAVALVSVTAGSASRIGATTRRIALAVFKRIAVARLLAQERTTNLVRKLSLQARSGVHALRSGSHQINRSLGGLRFWGRMGVSGISASVAPTTESQPNLEDRSESKVGHEEPALTQSTALICIEPLRSSLPVVQTWRFRVNPASKVGARGGAHP
jgi:hypothetical protein